MIIRIEKSGGSFRGAGLYYLHDKAAERDMDRMLKPKTDERVWFTDTRNCMETDPQRALDEMWRTAEDQNVLKRAAGVRTSGRACEDPVKTISLSWHKDDKPTAEHMVESADQFLKHMGWDAHQAVYVAHHDTEHRHIHIILNRVNHEDGRTLDDYRERKRAQGWALHYEREQGQVRCEQREARAHLRDQATEHTWPNAPEAPVPQRAANDHLPHNVVMMTRPFEREFNSFEALRASHDAIEDKAHLKVEQREERQQFFKDGAALFKETRHAVYDEVRAEYKEQWAALYKEARAAEHHAEAVSNNAISRAFHFAKNGAWEQAREAFGNRDSVRDAVAEEFKQRFADLKAQQMEDLRERQRDACDQLREVRDIQYRELLQRQRLERATVHAGIDLAVLDRDPSAPAAPANQNIQPTGSPDQHRAGATALEQGSPTTPDKLPGSALTPVAALIETAVRSEEGASIEGLPQTVTPEESSTNKQVADLAAGAIGSLASYVADQLGEMFAPTPPEVREAQAKADAKREAEKPAPSKPDANYEKIIADAIRAGEQDAKQRGEEWWKERDRGKGWERDQ